MTQEPLDSHAAIGKNLRMSGLVVAHLILIGLWGGCVAVEMLLEIQARRNLSLWDPVARFHETIDKYIEVPLVTGVLLTGLAQIDSSKFSAIYAVKIAAGLAAVLANYVCVIPVLRRGAAARRGDTVAIERHTEQLFFAFKVGFPAGVIALYAGLKLAGVLG